MSVKSIVTHGGPFVLLDANAAMGWGGNVNSSFFKEATDDYEVLCKRMLDYETYETVSTAMGELCYISSDVSELSIFQMSFAEGEPLRTILIDFEWVEDASRLENDIQIFLVDYFFMETMQADPTNKFNLILFDATINFSDESEVAEAMQNDLALHVTSFAPLNEIRRFDFEHDTFLGGAAGCIYLL